MKAKLTTRTIQDLRAQAKPYDVRDTELSGFLLRVQPSGGQTYFCDFRRRDGARTRVKIGDAAVLSPAQARDEALKVLADVVKGTDPVKERRKAKAEILSSFVENHYRPWVLQHRKTALLTLARIEFCFKEFMGCPLSEISAWKLEKWRSASLKTGKTPATINRDINALRGALQKAAEWGIVERSPLKGVRALKTDSAPKVRFLSHDEESSLRAALDVREAKLRAARRSHNAWLSERGLPQRPDLDRVCFGDYLMPMVLVLLNTGLRRGEIFSLGWTDVDLERRVLTVAGDTAKSGKTRHIPLNVEAHETLASWRDQAESTDGLVFPGKGGDRFNNITKSWASVLETAKITCFRLHDTRHHFASRLVMAGVDLNTVRELLGHADLKMTIRYAHLAPQVKADAVAQLDRYRAVDPAGSPSDKLRGIC